MPDFSYTEIIARTATTITVKVNASKLGFDNGRYWLSAPLHVNPATGATFEPEYNTSYLWGKQHTQTALR